MVRCGNDFEEHPADLRGSRGFQLDAFSPQQQQLYRVFGVDRIDPPAPQGLRVSHRDGAASDTPPSHDTASAWQR